MDFHHNTVAAVPPPASTRLHAFDGLRGFALLGGVVLHMSMSFMPGAKYFWVASDVSQGIGPALLFYLLHLFRMVVFFFIAGYFGRMSLERLGTKAFLRDRWKRVGVPLFAGWPIIFTAIVAALAWGAYLKSGGLPKTPPPGPAFTPDDFPLTHLWFLYVLLLFYLGTLMIRRVVNAVDRAGHLHAALDRLMPLVARWWLAALLAAPLAAALYFHPKWYPWFGIPTPDQSLYPNLAALTAYGSAFALGWLLQRQPVLLGGWARHWLWHLLIATAAVALCLSIVGVSPGLKPAARDSVSLAYAVSYSLAVWCTSFAVIGLALRFWSGENRLRRYLADASYWIYLIHLPLVMLLQTTYARVELSWMIKLPLMLVFGLNFMLLSYALLVRNTWLGAALNGRRMDDNSAKPAPRAVALENAG